MMLVEVDDEDGTDLADLDNDQLRSLYAESVDDYEGSLMPEWQGYEEYQRACADAVMILADEARRRGLLRNLH